MKATHSVEIINDINMPFNYYQREDQVLLAVVCIIFGFYKKNLKVLLIKRNFELKWQMVPNW